MVSTVTVENTNHYFCISGILQLKPCDGGRINYCALCQRVLQRCVQCSGSHHEHHKTHPSKHLSEFQSASRAFRGKHSGFSCSGSSIELTLIPNYLKRGEYVWNRTYCMFRARFKIWPDMERKENINDFLQVFKRCGEEFSALNWKLSLIHAATVEITWPNISQSFLLLFYTQTFLSNLLLHLVTLSESWFYPWLTLTKQWHWRLLP